VGNAKGREGYYVIDAADVILEGRFLGVCITSGVFGNGVWSFVFSARYMYYLKSIFEGLFFEVPSY
jgi:hypothetical protein